MCFGRVRALKNTGKVFSKPCPQSSNLTCNPTLSFPSWYFGRTMYTWRKVNAVIVLCFFAGQTCRFNRMEGCCPAQPSSVTEGQLCHVLILKGLLFCYSDRKFLKVWSPFLKHFESSVNLKNFCFCLVFVSFSVFNLIMHPIFLTCVFPRHLSFFPFMMKLTLSSPFLLYSVLLQRYEMFLFLCFCSPVCSTSQIWP